MSGTGLAVAILSGALARALTSAGQAGRRPVARCTVSKARGVTKSFIGRTRLTWPAGAMALGASGSAPSR